LKLISDDILFDTGQNAPTFDATYPTFGDFRFWDPSAWTNGHPFEHYKQMREDAPVMWTAPDQKLSGFWSVTRYEDIKTVELDHRTF